MIDMISNYEKAKISMARVFLQYDQAAMIHKYSLEYDSDWLYILLSTISIASTEKREMFSGQIIILKRSMNPTIMRL